MRGHAMSKAALVLLDQMTTEIDTLLRVNKKGECQCAICGRRAATAAAIDHTAACSWRKLVALSEQLRDALKQSEQ